MKLACTFALVALVTACSAESETPSPRLEVAAVADSEAVVTSWSRERPSLSAGSSCEQDSVPLSVFLDSSASGPALLVHAASLDTVAGYRIATASDRCGYAAGLVRQLATEAPEFLALPPGFIDGLTTYGFDSTGRRVVYVDFDGQNGAFAVVRSVPEYGLLARSRRVDVPSGDAPCGFAGFDGAASWLAYICTSDPNPQHYVRVRGRLGDSTILIDTTTLRAGGAQ